MCRRVFNMSDDNYNYNYRPLMSVTALFTDYANWLKTAKPNEKFIYYKGNSPADSIIGSKMAHIVSMDAHIGRVYLLRKKISNFNFHFIAVKASPIPNYSLVPFSEYLVKRRKI